MNPQEQHEHDRAVEVFVDETLAGARNLLSMMEKDMKLCDTVIPAEDTTLYNATACRVYLIWKLFEGWGATLLLNEHVRRVLTAEGRKEINDDIEVRMDRANAWIVKTAKANPTVREMIRGMGWAASTASTLYQQHPGGQPKL